MNRSRGFRENSKGVRGRKGKGLVETEEKESISATDYKPSILQSSPRHSQLMLLIKDLVK